MNTFKAIVESIGYEFDVNAEDEHDAYSTALEYCDLIGQPDWKTLIRIEKAKMEEL